MNKKLLILSLLLVASIVAVAFLYMDDILSLVGLGSSNSTPDLITNQPQQQQKKMPIALPVPELLENTLASWEKLSLETLGYKQISSFGGVKYDAELKINLSDEIAAFLPDNLKKYRDLFINYSIMQKIKSSEMSLQVSSSLTKTLIFNFSKNNLYFILPDAKELYFDTMKELEEISKTSENNDIKNSFSNLNFSKKEVIKKFLEEVKVSKKIKGNFIELTLEDLKSKKDDGKDNPKPKSNKEFDKIYLFIDKETLKPEKLEIEYNENAEPKRELIIQFTYNEGKLPLKIEFKNIEDFKTKKKYEFSINCIYSNSLLSKLKFDSEGKELAEVNLNYTENKFSGFNIKKEIEKNIIEFSVNNFEVNPKFKKDDFSDEKYKDFARYSLTKDLKKHFEDKSILTKIFNDNPEQLMGAAFGAVMSMSMKQANNGSANFKMTSIPENPAETEIVSTEIPAEKNKPSDDLELLDEGDEDIEENEAEEKTSEKTAEKADEPAVKKTESKPEPVQEPEETEVEDDEDDIKEIIEPVKKETQKNIQKKSEPVKTQPVKSPAIEKKSIPEPVKQKKETSVSKSVKASSSQDSIEYKKIINSYNSGKIKGESAIKQLKALLKDEPENTSALYLTGLVYYKDLKDFSTASKYFNKVVEVADLDDKTEKQIYYWAKMLNKRISNK